MGTNLQEVFDAFFVKLPHIDFSGKGTQVIQLLKSAIGRYHRHVYDSLEYVYNESNEEGNFLNTIGQSTIELLSTHMVKEYISIELSLLTGRKQYLGTQAFNKIPSYKEKFDTLVQSLKYWQDEIDRLLKDMPDYSDER